MGRRQGETLPPAVAGEARRPVRPSPNRSDPGFNVCPRACLFAHFGSGRDMGTTWAKLCAVWISVARSPGSDRFAEAGGTRQITATGPPADIGGFEFAP